MERLLLLLMIAAGGVAALALRLAVAAARSAPEPPRGSWAPPEEIAASVLHAIARCGGASPDEASRLLHAHWPGAATVEPSIDLRSWAEAFARQRAEEARCELLEASVRLAVAMSPTIPLTQYNALLDVCFGLGFHADALARLRAIYRFEYVDHAKRARPRSADRAGGAVLFRRRLDRAALLRTLELDGEPDRGAVISAYRRLAVRYHPDRWHDAAAEEQREASRRFIEITEAYEQLLQSLGDKGP